MSGSQSEAATVAGRATTEIAHAPSSGELVWDRLFRRSTFGIAAFTVLLTVYVVFSIARVATPAIHAYGWRFMSGQTWDANRAEYGILPAIAGTLYSSFLGLIAGTLFGLAIAIFLSERFLSSGLESVVKALGLEERSVWATLPDRIENLLRTTIELLAAIPSVVYGLWGIFVVIPMVRPPANWLHDHLGWIPIFGTPLSGPGLLPAAVVLAIMVLPTISAISRDGQ